MHSGCEDCACKLLLLGRMTAQGQTFNDRILAAKHSIAGQVPIELLKTVLASSIKFILTYLYNHCVLQDSFFLQTFDKIPYNF